MDGRPDAADLPHGGTMAIQSNRSTREEMKKISTITLLSLLASCASTPTVRTDADPGAAFASYRTFKWIQSPDGVSPLLQQRIVQSVNQQLAAKGWTESADADVAIAAHVATEQRQDIDTFYNGPSYAGWGWRGPWAVGSTSTSIRNYTVGTLVVDLFDTKTRQAVWRGSAQGSIPSSSERLNEGVQAGIVKMFAEFPPQK